MLIVAVTGLGPQEPGVGGWAWTTSDGRSAQGHDPATTAGRMELTATAEALEAVGDRVVLCTRSTLVVRSFTEWVEEWRWRGWRTASGQPIRNLDLVQRIAAALEGREVTFELISPASGHLLNDEADALARTALDRARSRLA